MIVVVGGQSRKAGKTRAVCDIIAATPQAGWFAIKVSPHEHAPAAGDSDTSRYVHAGAVDAALVRELPPLPPDRNVIIESNSVVEFLQPSLFVFVTDPQQPEWKQSAARVLPRADCVVSERVTPEVIERVRALLGSPHSDGRA